MPLHLDALSRLHTIWGIFGILTGASLEVLAVGTRLALEELGTVTAGSRAAVWLLVTVGAVLIMGGIAMIFIGRGLARRRKAGRALALAGALPNLVLVPFGTALSIYTFWVLLNDDARRQFGRPPRVGASFGPVDA
jgi:hypothetical protein